MPKQITLEMLHEMTPDQRKTLHRNASGLDTDAARDVLALLEQDGLMERPKAPAKKATAVKKTAASKTAVKKTATKKTATKAKTPAAAKPVKAVHGRQA